MENRLIVSSSPHIRSNITTQRIMRDVLIGLTPATLYGIYVFGLRALIITVLSIVTAVVTEAICQKIRKQPLTISDLSAVVTGLLLAMNLPSAVPYWIPVVGSAFAIAIVKQAFGGLGHNFINPALAARALLLASWPVHMTTWLAPHSDTITSPTVLGILKEKTGEQLPSIMDMFIGNIGGCIGETSAMLLILGGIYLIARGVISFKIPGIYIGTVAILTLFATGFDFELTLIHLVSGGLMLGAFFMATDYASSPITPLGQTIYAVGLGIITVVIRQYGGYPEGVSYSILLMNVAAPLIDKYTKQRVFGGAKK